MRWWWFWRENNRNKIPLIPTPHFHPQFSYSLHHDHYCHISMVSSLLPPRHPPMHFYCFQHHQHHISILLSPPPPSPKQPHFSSFPSTTTITTLLLFSHHHNISIVFFSIVSRATLWRHIIGSSRARSGAPRVRNMVIYASKKFWCWGNRPFVRPPIHVSGCQITHFITMCKTWCWTYMLWSIDSCQKRVSADQCHMTASQVQVHNSRK